MWAGDGNFQYLRHHALGVRNACKRKHIRICKNIFLFLLSLSLFSFTFFSSDLLAASLFNSIFSFYSPLAFLFFSPSAACPFTSFTPLHGSPCFLSAPSFSLCASFSFPLYLTQGPQYLNKIELLGLELKNERRAYSVLLTLNARTRYPGTFFKFFCKSFIVLLKISPNTLGSPLFDKFTRL